MYTHQYNVNENTYSSEVKEGG
ncbi:hypothetical protein AX774_g6927, partial [Zancudomyces culisetae]